MVRDKRSQDAGKFGFHEDGTETAKWNELEPIWFQSFAVEATRLQKKLVGVGPVLSRDGYYTIWK